MGEQGVSGCLICPVLSVTVNPLRRMSVALTCDAVATEKGGITERTE
jgi:hypothetical protein